MTKSDSSSGSPASSEVGDATTKKPPDHHGEGSASESAKAKTEQKASRKGIDWTDPKVLAGNAPEMSGFPLVLAVFAWLSWVVFLVVLLLTRTDLATI